MVKLTIKDYQAIAIVDALFNGISEESRKIAIDKVTRVLTPEFNEVFEEFESSNISSYRYDNVAKVLQVRFHNGGKYQYYGVEENKIKELNESSSKGKFLAKDVFKSYPYMRLTLT